MTNNFPHVFTLTTPGRRYALDDVHVVAIRAWMTENLCGASHSGIEPISPEPIGFQSGGVIRLTCEVDAFYFHMRWSELVTKYRVYEDDAA